jgi:DNA-binding NarL/FixJ family response regulator
MTTRVVIIDDEQLIRTGLRAIIDADSELEVVGEGEDGVEVATLVRTHRPDVVLMDVRMPKVDGIQATANVVRAFDEPPRIIVITTFENDEYVYNALRAGASGFLLKRSRPAEVVGAIKFVASGESLLFPAAIRHLAAEYANSSGGDALRDAGLTEREVDVLRLMATGMSNAEIAGDLVLGVETIKTHVGNVLMKLGARDRTQAVVIAYESGFITPSG